MSTLSCVAWLIIKLLAVYPTKGKSLKKIKDKSNPPKIEIIKISIFFVENL